MAKRPQKSKSGKHGRSSSGGWKPPKPRPSSQAHGDRQIIEQVVSLWAEAAKGVTPQTVDRYLYGITVGTMTAAKLAIRLNSGGTLSFMGDPRVFQSIEELADEVASEFYDVVARDVFRGEPFRDRIGTEKRFLRAVGDPMSWRWSKETVQLDDQAPISPEGLIASRELADDLSWKLVDFLGASRGAVAHDRDLARTEMIAQLVGMSAASKLLLAIWENETKAATLEWIAEQMSEVRYRELTEAAR